MKKIMLFLVVVLVLGSCDMGMFEMLFGTFELESGDVGATEAATTSGARALNVPNGLKVSFKSDYIEFWSTDDFNNLSSARYSEIMTEGNFSDSIDLRGELPGEPDNVVFMPNKVKLSQYKMPVFDTSKTYNLVRMSISYETMNYTMNGNPMKIAGSGLGTHSLEGNSIMFVDRAVLHNIVYVSNVVAADILKKALGHDYYVSEYDFGEDTEFITNFIINNTVTKGMDGMSSWESIDGSYTDFEGGLFVPFDPIEFKENGDKVKIKIEWDIDTIFESVNEDEYTLADNADGTPYDFKISVEVK